MTATANARNLGQYKITFYLIVEQILAFGSSPNRVGEVKSLSPNFKQDAWKYKVEIQFCEMFGHLVSLIAEGIGHRDAVMILNISFR